jgi:meso-butanediol dehydrogenase/(S,S)-butanediol dehydrogenase/diacetyl reductase
MTAQRSALVTGAGGAIGRAIACALAAQGLLVVVADRSNEAAQASARAVEEIGGRALAVTADVTSRAELAAAVAAAAQPSGRLDVMVNAAGVAHVKPLLDISAEEFELVFAVNARGVLHGIQAAAAAMIAAGAPGGRIINIASAAASGARPLQAVYAASKATVLSLTRSAAVALAPHQINVNAISPSYVDTELGRETLRELARYGGEEARARAVPQGLLAREAQVEDVAAAAVFLAGPGGDYITGQVINVDGGRTL